MVIFGYVVSTILIWDLVKIFDNIEKIYLLEMVPETYSLIKKIADYNGTSQKLSCIIGDFNRTKFQDNSVDIVFSIDLNSPIEDELVFSPQFRDQYAPGFGSIENDWQKIISIAAPNSGWWYSGDISTEEEYANKLGWDDSNELPKPSWTDLENIFYDQQIMGLLQ